MAPNLPKSGPNMDQKGTKKGPKRDQKGTKLEPKRGQNSPKGNKRVQKLQKLQNETNLELKWGQKGTKMGPKGTKKRPKGTKKRQKEIKRDQKPYQSNLAQVLTVF